MDAKRGGSVTSGDAYQRCAPPPLNDYRGLRIDHRKPDNWVYSHPTTQEGRNITPALSAFLRDHFAPVAKPPAITYPSPWMPTKGDMEPPF